MLCRDKGTKRYRQTHIITSSSKVSVEVQKGQEFFEREYPCLAAVNRAASTVRVFFQRHINSFPLKVPRHDGRVLWLTYKPEGNIKKTVYLVSLFYLGAFFTFTSGFRWARVSPMTLVVLTSRLEVSWQVVLMLYYWCQQ